MERRVHPEFELYLCAVLPEHQQRGERHHGGQSRPIPVRPREPDPKDHLRGTQLRDACISHRLSERAGVRLNAYPAGDAILDIGAVSFQNSNTFCEESANDSHTCSAAANPGPNFTISRCSAPSTTCSTSSVDASFSNYSNFEPNIAVLVYSEGEVDYANAPSMTGQILACGGLTGTNAFTLTFNPSAAYEVFGSPGVSSTVTTNDKYIAAGSSSRRGPWRPGLTLRVASASIRSV